MTLDREDDVEADIDTDGHEEREEGEPDLTGWERLLAQVRADALDCLQSNVAVLADRWHGPGTHLALGATWGFRTGADSGVDGGVERPPAERLAEAARALGLRGAQRWRTTDETLLRRAARERGPLYVVGDAHLMPWLPYAGHEHMTHSFLLCAGPDDDRTTVVDAYHNDTRWGPARPGAWTLPAAETAPLFGAGVTAHLLAPAAVPEARPGQVLADNAARLDAAGPDRERYLAAARRRCTDEDAVGRLILDIWLLVRERALHEAWLRHSGLPAEAVRPMADLVGEWRALATHSYVAGRRQQRSGVWDASVPDRMADLLRREADVAHQLTRAHTQAQAPGNGGAGPEDEAVAAIRRALMEALSVDAEALDRAPHLTELPGFDSYRLVEVLDSVEHDLGRPYDPAGLSARSVRNAVSLAELFSAAATATRETAATGNAGSGVPS
ncbi:hypothetical protein [Streptomyces sp. B6B3]|uniref:hypothetical protein n=1 Tax=Streptomyces sp. B6B3 TaxID=3153570 RepID=UPI00325EAA5C